MPENDYTADRAAFDEIIRNQLADFELGLASDERIEVDQHEAGMIDAMVTGLEETTGLSGGFGSVTDILLRNLWIRPDDED